MVDKIFKTLGASNHCPNEREKNDYYATEPKAADLLMCYEKMENVWECAAGERHLADVFEECGILGKASDLIVRCPDVERLDFLTYNGPKWNGDIVTNPPYSYGLDFVYKALESVTEGRKVCMFLKVQFLEGKERKKLFTKYPPKTIYVSSSRLLCAKNGEFERMRAGGGSAVAYAWYVWVKGYSGETVIKWIN